MVTAYIALGSNLGDRWETLSAAVRRLRAEPGLRVIDNSEVYETAPLHCPPGSGDFLNAVVAIETDRSPEDLLQLLLRIERTFGRVRGEPNSPRTLDLDLILYGDRIINTPDLVIPHPRMHERDFVLAPLAELYGSVGRNAFHPVLKKTAQELYEPFLARYSDPSVPRPLLYIEHRQKPQELAGLRALVTGSTSGIGASIAGEFEARGATVVGHGRREKLDPAERFISDDLRDPTQAD